MNNDELQRLISDFAVSNGATPQEVKSDPKNKAKVEGLLKNLSDAQAQKLRQVLSDPEKSREILNSPAAQALIKKLMK